MMRYAFTLILAIVVTLSINTFVSAQSKSRKEIEDEITAKRSELASLEEQFLQPSEADKAEWAELLKEPKTGLIRLLPREKFDSETYKENKKTLTIRGGGAYYSFTRLTHEYGFGSDIELDSNNLNVGFAGADYGMIMKIGDVPLQEVSIDNSSVGLLARYEPPSNEPEVRVEQRRFMTGTTLDAQPVKSRVPVETHSTYILRSISFDRSDVLVAMRVARRDSDGSIIVAWKLLHKYHAPKLVSYQSN